MNYNPFVMAELLATRDRLEQYKKCFSDPDCRIQNAIECYSYMIDTLTGGQLSETEALKEWVNYCVDSFSKDMPKKAYNQVLNNSQVDVSVSNDSDVIEDIKLPNTDVPYNEKGYFNFTVTYDKEYETDKAYALLFKYAGKEYIHYHAKMYPIKYDKLGIKSDSTLEYKIFRIDRQNKKKIKCRTLSAKEFAVLVLSSEQK